MKIKIIILVLCVLYFSPFISSAQPGSLDSTFSFDGKVTTAVGNSASYGNSVAIQKNGKIIVAGYSWNGANADFALVRYNTDGSLDNTFDYDGKATANIGKVNDYGNSVAIQNDEKIIIAGYSWNGSDYDFSLVRFNSDGRLDNSFSSDGKLTTAIGSGSDLGKSVTIQNDGKIVAAGMSYNGFSYDFALVRYNIDGTLDNTFDDDGKVTTGFGNYDGFGYSIAIQEDGKIVVAGATDIISEGAIVRYNRDGSLDNTFGAGGKVSTDFGGTNNFIRSVTLQSDGKIIVAGESIIGPCCSYDFVMARYNIDGTLDNTFGAGGIINTDFGHTDNYALAVVTQNDGKIVVAGRSYNGSDYDFALARYNTDGTPDNMFDSDGKVITAMGDYNDCAKSVAIQDDGKIVVAGYSYNGTKGDFVVARYNNNSLTGLEEAGREKLTLEIYPNPTNGEFQIAAGSTSDSKYNLEIYNVLGVLVYSKTVYSDPSVSNNTPDTRKETIYLTHQSKGIYFVEMTSASGRKSKKMIIE